MSTFGAYTSNTALDRFRYVFRKKQSGHTLSVYDGKKLIGKVGAITEGYCYPDSDPEMVKYRRPANVVSAEILEEYRGQKLYQEMLLRFREYANQTLGCKGLTSKGFQRSSMATRAWEKVATRHDVDSWGRKDFYLDGLGKVLDTAEGYRIEVKKTRMTNFYETDTSKRYYDLFVAKAFDREGGLVGSVDATEKSGRLEAGMVFVSPEHRRKGVASAMYRELEQASGLKMAPSGSRTEEGQALWAGGSAEQGQFGRLPTRGRIPMATVERALSKLGRKVKACKITPAALRAGMEVEREHRDVTGGAMLKTAKIAAAHLCEDRRYYAELKKLEAKLKRSRR